MSETAGTWASDAFGDVLVVERACPRCGRNNAETGRERYGRDIWRVLDCVDCGNGVFVESWVCEAASRKVKRRDKTEREKIILLKTGIPALRVGGEFNFT